MSLRVFRDALEQRRARRPQDELQKGACRPEPPVLPLGAYPAALQVQQDESVLSLARPLQVPLVETQALSRSIT